MGFYLPFTAFELDVLNYLMVALSQLHPPVGHTLKLISRCVSILREYSSLSYFSSLSLGSKHFGPTKRSGFGSFGANDTKF